MGNRGISGIYRNTYYLACKKCNPMSYITKTPYDFKEIFGDWESEAKKLHKLYQKMGTKDMMYLIEKYQREIIAKNKYEMGNHGTIEEHPYLLTRNSYILKRKP